MFFGSSSLAAALAALATFAPGAEGLAIERVDKRQNASFHWVDTWTSMPQLVEQSNLPPSQFVRFSSCFHFLPFPFHFQ
jgi:hypothetical protein